MGRLSRYLRGTDLLEDRTHHTPGEARSLPRPENELPLLGAYTVARTITPAAALAIADVWAAVRVLADAASSLPLHVYRDAPLRRPRPGQDGPPRRPSRAARSGHLPGRPGLAR